MTKTLIVLSILFISAGALPAEEPQLFHIECTADETSELKSVKVAPGYLNPSSVLRRDLVRVELRSGKIIDYTVSFGWVPNQGTFRVEWLGPNNEFFLMIRMTPTEVHEGAIAFGDGFSATHSCKTLLKSDQAVALRCRRIR